MPGTLLHDGGMGGLALNVSTFVLAQSDRGCLRTVRSKQGLSVTGGLRVDYGWPERVAGRRLFIP